MLRHIEALIDQPVSSLAWLEPARMELSPPQPAKLEVARQKPEGLDRHQRLIDSYKKLHMARANVAALSS